MFAFWLRGRTRKDGRVTGPVRQAASWKRWHGAAKRSVLHRLTAHPKDLGRFSVIPTTLMDVFVADPHRIFVCKSLGLARFYAALPCHAAIVPRGLSLTRLEKVHYILGVFL